jgi:hypothetical protein
LRQAKVIGALRRYTALINAGADLLQFVNTPQRALADAKSPGSRSPFMPVLFSVAL